MKKFLALIIGFIFVLGMGVSCFAQEPQRIAYVDLSRIFDEHHKTAQFDKVLEEKSVQYQKERNKKLERIQEAERRLTLLREEERQKLHDQIQRDKNDLAAFDRKNQTDLRRERDDKIREILLEIEKTVQGYAEQENFDIILNDRVLIYGGPSLDLTDTIINILNRR